MSSSRVVGRVVAKETNAGVPDVLVLAEDVSLRAATGDASLSRAASPAYRSLGSVLTDARGSFEIEYTSRPDHDDVTIILSVRAPEGGEGAPQTLFQSQPRKAAGAVESYIVRLDATVLEEAGVPVSSPSGSERMAAAAVAGLAAEHVVESSVASGITSSLTGAIQQERARRATLVQTIQPALLRDVTRAGVGDDAPRTLVAPGESVVEKNLEAIARGITEVVNNAGRRAAATGRIVLTDADRATLEPYRTDNGVFEGVPAEIAEPILYRGTGTDEDGRATVLMRRQPGHAQVCLPHTDAQRCAEEALGLRDTAEEPGDGAVPSPDDGDAPDGVVLDSIERLLDPLRAPDRGHPADLRADAEAVRREVRAFLLTGGAADVPAFHDFHHLQIAFENVWQEAIDEGLLDAVIDVYREIVELGGEPDLSEAGVRVSDALRSELRVLERVRATARRGADLLSGLRGASHEGRGRDGTEVRDHRDGGTWSGSCDDPVSDVTHAAQLLRDLEHRG